MHGCVRACVRALECLRACVLANREKEGRKKTSGGRSFVSLQFVYNLSVLRFFLCRRRPRSGLKAALDAHRGVRLSWSWSEGCWWLTFTCCCCCCYCYSKKFKHPGHSFKNLVSSFPVLNISLS